MNNKCSKCGVPVATLPGVPRENLTCSLCARAMIELGSFDNRRGLLGDFVDEHLRKWYAKSLRENSHGKNV